MYTDDFGRNQFFWLCKEPSNSLTSRMFDLSVSALAPCGKVCNSSKQVERVWLRAFSITSISCRFTLNELAYFIPLPLFFNTLKNHSAAEKAITALTAVSKRQQSWVCPDGITIGVSVDSFRKGPLTRPTPLFQKLFRLAIIKIRCLTTNAKFNSRCCKKHTAP